MLSARIAAWTSASRDPEVRETDDPEAVVAALMDPDSLVWVDLLAPTASELTEVGAPLGLHALEIEDAIAPRERPKAAQHEDHASFVVYALTPRSDVARAIEVDERARRAPAGPDAAPDAAGAAAADAADALLDRVLEGQEAEASFGDALFAHTRVAGFVLPGGVLAVRSDDALTPDAVEAGWRELGDARRLGPYGLVHGLLDVVVDGLFDAARFLDDRIEDLEEDLFDRSAHLEGFQRRAYALRKELVALRRAVLPLRDVHSALWRRRPEDAGAGGEAARLDALYADLLDHILRVTEWTESLRDMIATVFETHLSLQDQRLNEVMRRLAGWAAVVSVPTLATGWFGMNVPYPGQSSPLGLVLAVLTVVVPAATIWWALRRRGWL